VTAQDEGAPEERVADDERVEDQRAALERARRRARVFGDVLPEETQDDRRTDSSAEVGETGEEWLRANVPPHHG
jgi:hypothetical protein